MKKSKEKYVFNWIEYNTIIYMYLRFVATKEASTWSLGNKKWENDILSRRKHKSITMKLDEFKIKFTSPQGVFTAGEQVSGVLQLHLVKPMKMRCKYYWESKHILQNE